MLLFIRLKAHCKLVIVFFCLLLCFVFQMLLTYQRLFSGPATNSRSFKIIVRELQLGVGRHWRCKRGRRWLHVRGQGEMQTSSQTSFNWTVVKTVSIVLKPLDSNSVTTHFTGPWRYIRCSRYFLITEIDKTFIFVSLELLKWRFYHDNFWHEKNSLTFVLFCDVIFCLRRFVLAATCWSSRWTTGRATTWHALSAGPSSAGSAWKKFPTSTTSVPPGAHSGEKSLGNFVTQQQETIGVFQINDAFFFVWILLPRFCFNDGRFLCHKKITTVASYTQFSKNYAICFSGREKRNYCGSWEQSLELLWASPWLLASRYLPWSLGSRPGWAGRSTITTKPPTSTRGTWRSWEGSSDHSQCLRFW